MLLKTTVALLVLAAMPSFAQAQPANPAQLEREIERHIEEGEMPNGWWGIRVIEAESGREVYARNAQKSFLPASNTKLYTTAAALTLLGPEFRFETPLYTNGFVEDGVLQGNLIVRGSGDPVIGGRFNDGDLTKTFRDWADSLRAMGVTRIAGDIVGDDDFFDDLALGYGWAWDDETYWYSAEIGALAFNDNCIDFSIVSGVEGSPASITWEPAMTSYIEVDNATLTVPADSAMQGRFFRERGTNSFRISSRIPEGRTDTEWLTVTNPTLYFAHVLRETLIAEGIGVEGQATDVDDLSFKPEYGDTRMRRVATHVSPPLKDIVHAVNKPSQNLYAEMLIKAIGAYLPVRGSEQDPGSAAMGIERALDVYGAARVDTAHIQLADGSGLSRHNLITPEMTTTLLRHMVHHPNDSTSAAFIRSLPIGGVDGTLSSRMRSGNAHGNVQAKTGTLSNASALSGYVRSASGTPLIFSIMNNNYTSSSSDSRRVQDLIVETLASYRR